WPEARRYIDEVPHTDPLEPSTAYLAHLAEETDARMRQSTAPQSPFAGAPVELSDAVESAAERLAPELDHVVAALHAEPETAYEEHRSVATLVALLDRHGIRAEAGVHGVDTAF